MDDLAARLHEELLARGLTAATAESLTGGSVAALVSSVPGASATFVGGVVAYATDVKHELLGVSDETVQRHGAVSARCAAEMATGVRALMRADVAVSTTGVAGPTEQEGKPVGLVYIGVAGPSEVETFEVQLAGGRDAIRAETTLRAVAALLRVVAHQPGSRLD